MPRKRASEISTYDSDDGFVANDNEDDRPKSKRAKPSQKATAPAGRKNGRAGGKEEQISGGGKVDANGDAFWETNAQLSALRRLTISEFKGKRMVNIREYYEKDGESLPGKKVCCPFPSLHVFSRSGASTLPDTWSGGGISMPMEQYAALVRLLPHVEAVLKGKGEVVPRPDYESGGRAGDDDEGEGGGGGEGKGGSKGLGGGGAGEVDERKNFEATSEEDEG